MFMAGLEFRARKDSTKFKRSRKKPLSETNWLLHAAGYDLSIDAGRKKLETCALFSLVPRGSINGSSHRVSNEFSDVLDTTLTQEHTII